MTIDQGPKPRNYITSIKLPMNPGKYTFYLLQCGVSIFSAITTKILTYCINNKFYIILILSCAKIYLFTLILFAGDADSQIL